MKNKSFYVTPRTLAQLKRLAKTKKLSLNRWVLKAVAEKIKRDDSIDIDTADRRKKGEMYRVK
jgi:hypothetical protein